DDQQQPGEERRHGEANEGEGGGDVIEYRILLDSGEDADWQGDDQAAEVGHAHDGQGARNAQLDEVPDRNTAAEGKAPVAMGEGDEPLDVAHGPRLIESKRTAD